MRPVIAHYRMLSAVRVQHFKKFLSIENPVGAMEPLRASFDSPILPQWLVSGLEVDRIKALVGDVFWLRATPDDVVVVAFELAAGI